MQEKIARERRAERYEIFVSQIRWKMLQLSVADMAELFGVSMTNCESVVDVIRSHPDWDD